MKEPSQEVEGLECRKACNSSQSGLTIGVILSKLVGSLSTRALFLLTAFPEG